jgi:hypothetical protein
MVCNASVLVGKQPKTKYICNGFVAIVVYHVWYQHTKIVGYVWINLVVFSTVVIMYIVIWCLFEMDWYLCRDVVIPDDLGGCALDTVT